MQSNSSNSSIPVPIFCKIILSTARIHSIWGEVGAGKSTIAFQVVRDVLKTGKKVFYLQTKEAPYDLLLKRFFSDLSEIERENLLIWNARTFHNQFKIISLWPLMIAQLQSLLKKDCVGALIIDDLGTLYRLALGSDIKNVKMNRRFEFIAGTLSDIVLNWKIPILILNSYSLKQKEGETSAEAIPYGGKILQFFTDHHPYVSGFNIRLNRTRNLHMIKFQQSNPEYFHLIPKEWIWNLSNYGFT